MQEASRYPSAPADEAAGEFQRGCTMLASNQRIKPDWGAETYTFNMN